jgi:aspartate racemase
MPVAVGILGGMGPAAGAQFAALFVEECGALLRSRGQPLNDQAYPPHWLVQVPVPDRTAALLADGPSPLDGMADALGRLRALGVRAAAIACNTAHAWHVALSESSRGVELLHVVHETARALHGARRVGLLATPATHRLRLYESVLEPAGFACFTPDEDEQAEVMRGIRDGVKAGDLDAARAVFERIATRLVERHALDTLVLACTEIPLALQRLPGHPRLRMVDPARVLAAALARRAYED